jgi:hypothetical protein
MCNTRNTRIIFMSNLLEQASLVMIPSGYKEDVVYSEIPINGAGDMSFTRASNGTRINSQGLVEVVPWNLFDNSENATSTNWGFDINLTSVTANSTTAPNGTNTGNLVVENSASGRHWFEQSFPAINGTPYTLSVYFKAKERTQCTLYGYADNGVFVSQQVIFDLSNGTVVSQSGTQTNSIENVGNGWYRCSMTLTSGASATGYWAYGLANGGSNNYQGNGTSGLYMWGRQLNTGTLKPYFPTTDRLNVPRLTYQNGGGGCPSLLLEKQSTNYAQYSEDFSNGFWTKDTTTTITANDGISPDGTQNADRFESPSSSKGIYSYGVSGSETISVYIKAGNSGNVGKSATLFTTTTTQDFILTNDWQRISVSGTASSLWALYPSATNSFTNVLIWGAQAESGSYPTSYIPTTSSSATRVIDDCRKTGISSLIGQSEGTLFIDLNLTAWDSNSFYFGLYGGGNEIYFRCTATGAIGFVHYFGSTQAFLSQSGLSLGRHKLAACYKNNDWAFYVDGILAGTDTSGTFSGTISEMVFGYTSISAYPPFHSVNQAILFPTRLTNAELQALTTL